jgi:hypothetical protein
MRRTASSLAVHFGIDPRRGAPTSGHIRYRPVAAGLSRMIVWTLAAAVVATAFVVAVGAASSLRDMIVGGALGAAIFGGIDFFGSVRHRIPRDDVPAPPLGVEIGDEHPPLLLLLLGLLTIVALAWLAAHWDLGPLFVPGQFVGYATSNAVALILVRRWESRQGRSLLVHHDRPGATSLVATDV